jgi:hypothetical protein
VVLQLSDHDDLLSTVATRGFGRALLMGVRLSEKVVEVTGLSSWVGKVRFPWFNQAMIYI